LLKYLADGAGMGDENVLYVIFVVVEI